MEAIDGRVGALEERMDHQAAMLGDLRNDVRQLGIDLRGELAQVRGEIGQVRGEIGQVRGEIGQLRVEFHDLRGEMVRRFEHADQRFLWLIGLMTAMLLTIIGGMVGALV
jgi:hypothetical protein